MFSLFRKDTGMFLIVGLGNPGDQYKNNRHNIGFMVVDEIADSYGFKPFRKKFQGSVSEGSVGDYKAVLLKPETYMNNSGQSVKAAATFFKIPPSRIITVHDELDLKLGDIRPKFGGGLAGHNGLKSMKAHLGTADFARIRFGIGHPGDKNKVSNYVLSDFSKAEHETVEQKISDISDHIPLLLDGETEEFARKINGE